MEKKSKHNVLHEHYVIAFWVTLTFAIALIAGGFLMPPCGKIDGSIMTCVGEIFLWPALAFAAKALSEGRVVSVKAGQASINVGKDEDGNGLDDHYEEQILQQKGGDDEA